MFSPEVVKNFDVLSQKRIEYVRNIKKNSHVHVLGACGTGTGAIVCLLKQLGFKVSGSDKAFYPPMGDFIKQFADVLYDSFSPTNLDQRPDLVVIGNALSRGNRELEEVIARKIPFCSMPELLSALLIGSREQNPTSIVVSGTHGKTTTTALHAHVLTELGRSPAYFFGGVPTGDVLRLPIKPHADDAEFSRRISVIEGDEYDSAFFAKYSKFHCYRPDVLVITNIEFDHGDIFQSLEDIKNEFRQLIHRVPESGCIVVCRDAQIAYELVTDTLLEFSTSKKPQVITYGFSKLADVRIVSKKVVHTNENTAQIIELDVFGENFSLTTGLTGDHNALNISALIGVFHFLKLDFDGLADAISSYSHVMRRQQIHTCTSEITLIEDFAHHPTEVFYTLSGIKEAFPNRRIVCVFEPRSNTSRRAFFRDEYEKALSIADVIVIKEVDSGSVVYTNTNQNTALLDVSELVQSLKKSREAYASSQVDNLFDYVSTHFEVGDVVVIMSNGDFGGVIKKFIDWGVKQP